LGRTWATKAGCARWRHQWRVLSEKAGLAGAISIGRHWSGRHRVCHAVRGQEGGKVLGEPMQIPHIGRYVSFFDTEGNRVSMLQPDRI